MSATKTTTGESRDAASLQGNDYTRESRVGAARTPRMRGARFSSGGSSVTFSFRKTFHRDIRLPGARGARRLPSFLVAPRSILSKHDAECECKCECTGRTAHFRDPGLAIRSPNLPISLIHRSIDHSDISRGSGQNFFDPGAVKIQPTFFTKSERNKNDIGEERKKGRDFD